MILIKDLVSQELERTTPTEHTVRENEAQLKKCLDKYKEYNTRVLQSNSVDDAVFYDIKLENLKEEIEYLKQLIKTSKKMLNKE